MGKKVIVALGGNAIQTGNGATAEDQQKACFETSKQIVKLIEAGYKVVVSHGNGPQVGNILLQQAASQSDKLPAMPIDTCGAMTEGMIGYWLQNALDEVLATNGSDKKAATIVTQTVVDKADPAFQKPTKPIGSFYTKEEADELKSKRGYVMIEDAGRGFRRVVPSPKPIDIVEKGAISTLVESGVVVIAGGGGGIPVVVEGKKYVGVEAVIDKDLASEKLAELLDCECFIVLTAVDHVAINFGKPNQEELGEVTVADLQKYIGENQFAPGSMLPKVEAAIDFVTSRAGRTAIITSLENAANAVKGVSGTRIRA